MAEKQRFLDVWIVESNTVYKEVPFTVVLDWLQQGRLLGDDQVRPAGSKDWRQIGSVPNLTAYLPRAEPLRAQDQAEALEPVQLDFGWKKPHADEDEDVDMIPLIDVSLVLLIFFMITGAAGSAATALIQTPVVESATVANTSGIWVGIDLTGEGGKRKVVYSVGEEGKRSPDAADNDIQTLEELVGKDGKGGRLDVWLAKKTAQVEVTINAHKEVKDGEVLKLTVELSKVPRRHKILAKYTGVTGKT